MLKRLKDLSSAVLAMAALGCMGTSAVQAQEVKKQWFAFASGNQPRATEKLVQKDIETRFAAHQAYGPFSWEMRGTTTLTDKIIYDYAIKPAKLIKTDWTYRFDSQAHGSGGAVRGAQADGAQGARLPGAAGFDDAGMDGDPWRWRRCRRRWQQCG